MTDRPEASGESSDCRFVFRVTMRHLEDARPPAHEFLADVPPPPGVTEDEIIACVRRGVHPGCDLVMAWVAVRFCATRQTEERELRKPLMEQLGQGGADWENRWSHDIGPRIQRAILGWEHEHINVGTQHLVGIVHVHAGITVQRRPQVRSILGSIEGEIGRSRVDALSARSLDGFIEQHCGGLKFFPAYLKSRHGHMSLRGLALDPPGWIDEAGPAPPLRVPFLDAPSLRLLDRGLDGWRIGVWFAHPHLRGHTIGGLDGAGDRDLADRLFVPIERDDAKHLYGRRGRLRGFEALPDPWKLTGWPADGSDWAVFEEAGPLRWRRGSAERLHSGDFLALIPAAEADWSIPGAHVHANDHLDWLELDALDGSEWRVCRVSLEAVHGQTLGPLHWRPGRSGGDRGGDWLAALQALVEDNTLLIDAAEPAAVLAGWTPRHAQACRVEVRVGGQALWEDVTDALDAAAGAALGATLPRGLVLTGRAGESGSLRVRGRGLRRGDPTLNVERRFRILDEVRVSTDRTIYAAGQGGRVERFDPGPWQGSWQILAGHTPQILASAGF